jgi:hypothetical protein
MPLPFFTATKLVVSAGEYSKLHCDQLGGASQWILKTPLQPTWWCQPMDIGLHYDQSMVPANGLYPCAILSIEPQ